MRKTIAALAVLFLFTGCFEIEQTINLDKNLSGTADFHLGVDMEPMIVVMAQFAREMDGKKGPVSAADIEKAKADFRKNSKKSDAGKPPTKEEMQVGLPAGVKLLDFKATEKEFGVATDFKYGFDKLSQLVGIRLPSKEGGDPTQKNIIETPFEGLDVTEKGNTITIKTKALNPAETVKEKAAADAPKMDPATEKLMKDAFSKLRVVYRITAPFTIVSHNATRKEGNTLIWEYDMKKFEELSKLDKMPDDLGVKVVYKR